MEKFTGECWIPGASPQAVEADHLARYHFAAKFAEGQTVLDIAAGAGHGTKMLRDAGGRFVVGVDLDPERVSCAVLRYAKPGLRYLAGDICSFEWPPSSLVVCFETIEHVKDYHDAILNLYELTAPGGKLLISTPLRSRKLPPSEKPDNPFHVHEFEIEELAGLIEAAGYRVTERLGQRQRDGSPEVGPIVDTPKFFVLVAERPDRANE